MHVSMRSSLLAAGAALLLGACSTLGLVGALLGNSIAFTAPQLQQQLDRRFPVDRWLSDYARREPVYQFDNGLMQRLQSRRIGATTIGDGQVVVHLDQ